MAAPKQKGGIRPKTLKNGNRAYEARYRDPSGRQRSKQFRTRADAQRFLNDVRAKRDQGQFVDPALSRVKFEPFAMRWLDTKRNLKPKTREGYEVILNGRVLPEFGARPLNRIDRLSVERWVAAMVAEGLSPAHIRHCVRLLRAILDAAVQADYISKNVATGVELPKMKPVRERRFLTAEEVTRLAAEMRPEYRALVLVLAYGGLRFGEVAALRHRHVDFLRRRILVTDSAAYVDGQVIFGDTKTGKGRTVILPQFVVDELSVHYRRVGLGTDPDALIFTAPKGGPLMYSNFRRNAWNPARERAGLAVTPHDLRHTCASLLRAMGADAKAVQTQLGHTSIQVTLDIYTHLFEGDLDDTMAALDAAHREVAARPILREVT